jgi:hypothetical protein
MRPDRQYSRCVAWQLSVPAIGFRCSDQRQPGSNVPYRTGWPATSTTAALPLSTNGRVSSGVATFLISRSATRSPPARSPYPRSLSSPFVGVNHPRPASSPGTGRRPSDSLLAKPDRAGLPPAAVVDGAGHGRCGVVRGCPLRTGQDCCKWHASGTAGEDDTRSSGQQQSPVHRSRLSWTPSRQG